MKAVIEFRKVSKAFGANQIFRELNLQIQDGEIVFVLGTSGTGKSVLLKSIVGLLKVDSGQVWVEGQNVTDLPEEELFPVRRRCGMVFQNPALFDSLSIYENVAYGAQRFFHTDEASLQQLVADCLKAVHLEGMEKKYPSEISFGMQKRVSLARTLAIRPKILLFDEPTTGLDPLTTKAINHLIYDLSKTFKTTSVVVSHDMACAMEIADRIFVLHQGGVVAQGTPSEIMENSHPLVMDFMAELREGPL